MTYMQKYLPAQNPQGSPRQDGLAPDSLADSATATGFGQMNYDLLDTELDADSRAFWCRMRPRGRPMFSLGLVHEIATMQADLQRLFAEYAIQNGTNARGRAPQPFDYFVFGSRTPGMFNLGGDLAHFAERIQGGDLEAMRRYGHACIEAVYQNATAFGLPITTIALVQGDALGGGFECALSYDMIVAERSAKMGMPEILFNLFPGMGGYSFLSRRIGPAGAEKIILSGKIYTAEELHAMGVVDVLAEDGQGEEAVRDYIERNSRKHNAYRALYQARRRVHPVSLDELRDVTDIWAEAAMSVTDADLRKMQRLAAAQDRRLAASNPGIAVAAE